MRDYIGSADAYYIFRGNYDGLIKSKLRDSSVCNSKMLRGLSLEREILEQVSVGHWITLQERIVHAELGYCKCTCDAVSEGQVILEAKTSEAMVVPESTEDLRVKWPSYYYQVQWQLWCAMSHGTPYGAAVVWCKCPAIETGESPFDEDGMLDLTMIEVRPDMQAFVRFQENAPKFWEKWMEAKERLVWK